MRISDIGNAVEATGGESEAIAIAVENTPVRRSPTPTTRMVPIAANLLTASEPAKIPIESTSSRVE
jgi:hypothetical protein